MKSRAHLLKALQHPVRLEILSRLDIAQRAISYSEFLPLVEASTGKLNYHLKILGDLIQKVDGGYRLTTSGVSVMSWLNSMTGIEPAQRPEVIVEWFPASPALGTKYMWYVAVPLVAAFIPLLIFVPRLLYLLALALAGGIWFVRAYTSTIQYKIDEAEVLVRKGVITRTEKIVPYRTITNLEVRRGYFDRRFGISTLVIQTAGNSTTGSEEVLVGLPDGEDIREAVTERIAMLNPPVFTGESESRYLVPILNALREVNQEIREI